MSEVEVVNMIKAIISSFDDGLPIEQLEDQYEIWGKSTIPYLAFGYNSLNELLRNYPEIKTTKNKQTESVFTVVYKPTKPRYEKRNNRKDGRFMPYKKARTSMPRRTVTPVNLDYSSSKDSFRSSPSFRPSSSSSVRTTSSYKSRRSQTPDITIDPHKSMENVNEPILNGQQLIGDDFALQIAIKTLDSKLYRKSEKAPLYSGLCVSGQSIRACTRRLKNTFSISNKVTIMLGSVDIYEGRTLKQMKEDYLELLKTLEENFCLSKSSITIGTIPPLANISFRMHYEEFSTLVCFNNWLRYLIDNRYDEIRQRKFSYKFIDFHKELLTDIEEVNYDYFQNDARNVSGTRHGYVFFNPLGRSKVVSLFFINDTEKSENNNYHSSNNWPEISNDFVMCNF